MDEYETSEIFSDPLLWIFRNSAEVPALQRTSNALVSILNENVIMRVCCMRAWSAMSFHVGRLIAILEAHCDHWLKC